MSYDDPRPVPLFYDSTDIHVPPGHRLEGVTAECREQFDDWISWMNLQREWEVRNDRCLEWTIMHGVPTPQSHRVLDARLLIEGACPGGCVGPAQLDRDLVPGWASCFACDTSWRLVRNA